MQVYGLVSDRRTNGVSQINTVNLTDITEQVIIDNFANPVKLQSVCASELAAHNANIYLEVNGVDVVHELIVNNRPLLDSHMRSENSIWFRY